MVRVCHNKAFLLFLPVLGKDWEEKQPACVERSPPLSPAEFQEISIGKALPIFPELRSSTLALFLAFVVRLWLQLDRAKISLEAR